MDDFVGTAIDFPETSELKRHASYDVSSKRMATFTNHPVGARGHQSYWNDGQVLKILNSVILRGAESDANNSDQVKDSDDPPIRRAA